VQISCITDNIISGCSISFYFWSVVYNKYVNYIYTLRKKSISCLDQEFSVSKLRQVWKIHSKMQFSSTNFQDRKYEVSELFGLISVNNKVRKWQA